MLEQSLAELLRRHYGLETLRLEPGSRGFVSDTWIVHTATDRFFAKLIPPVSYVASIIRALPVQQELYELGIHQMSLPVATLTGDLSVTIDAGLLVVNTFIDRAGHRITRSTRTSISSPGSTRRRSRADVDAETSGLVLPDLDRVLAAAIDGSFEDPLTARGPGGAQGRCGPPSCDTWTPTAGC